MFEISPQEERGLENIKTFADLFDLINSRGSSEEYRNAYDEAVSVAKNLVNTKNRPSWNGVLYEKDTAVQYPGIAKEFIATLRRCIEDYDPPVNLPNEPLW